MSDLDPKAPIPREEPPTPIPAPVEDAAQRTLRLLEQINVKQDTLAQTQATHGSMLGGITNKLAEHDAAIKELRGGSNPPPRTGSGFTEAVRRISQTTESDKDAALQAQLDRIEAKTDRQTELLHMLVDAGKSLIQNKWVRRSATLLAMLAVSYLSHLATMHGVTLP